MKTIEIKMREIKFRGKRINRNGEFAYGFLRYDEAGNYWVHPINDHPAIDADLVYTDSVGQYTGFKDSDNEEIYEGDIVELGDNKYQVIFEKGAFYLQHLKLIDPLTNKLKIWGLLSKAFEETFLKDLGKPRIVGNIFENPELLSELNN